jgi:chitodextrinase
LVKTVNLIDKSPNAQSATISFSNKPKGTYLYKAKLINRFGASTSSLLTYTVSQGNNGGGGTDTQAPTAPSNLSSTSIGATSIGLTWSAAIDNVGVVSYLISWTGGSLVVTSTNANVTGLTSNTAYLFSVKAQDAAGNQGPATSLNVRTSGNDNDGGIYPAWALNASYQIGSKVSYQGANYECMLSHIAYAETWNPASATTLWKKM